MAHEASAVSEQQHLADLGLTTSIAMVAPYDFVLDRELWCWLPRDSSVLLTRTRWHPSRAGLDQARAIGGPDELTELARSVSVLDSPVVGYLCTSASFVDGVSGERRLCELLRTGGFAEAVTTSGALVRALQFLGLQRVAVATPYDAEVTELLVSFLAESGFAVTGSAHLGLPGRIWTTNAQTLRALAHRVVTDDAEALFLSCTNVPSYDLIASLEQELQLPVLTANQVTMWACLRAAGTAAVGSGRLLERAQ
ncbi:hypothetical protein HJ590_12420 [Naumannella sp. ID2617S]|nr:hypothetical protein [Naumannella sp. ID2617S]